MMTAMCDGCRFDLSMALFNWIDTHIEVLYVPYPRYIHLGFIIWFVFFMSGHQANYGATVKEIIIPSRCSVLSELYFSEGYSYAMAIDSDQFWPDLPVACRTQ